MKLRLFGEEGFLKRLLTGNRKSPQQLFEYAKQLWAEDKIADGCSAMQMAAKLGHAEAAYTMTVLIKQEAFPGTMADIVKYLTIAAKHNHMFALNDLGNCYREGICVKKDVLKALELYKRAYKLGDNMAAFNIAQTQLIEFDCKGDSTEGMDMMIMLAKNGMDHAIEFLDDLRSRGLQIPEHAYKPEGDTEIDQVDNEADTDTDNEDTEIDYAPECQITDAHIAKLYEEAKRGTEEAINELMELGGNQFNRQAMNALRKLGRIKEDMSRNFKDGCANFMYDAWAELDIERLRVLASWTYPTFEYEEYIIRDGKWHEIYEGDTEADFIDRIAAEMNRCKLRGIKPKLQLLAFPNTGDRCVAVMIDDDNISRFQFKFDNGHYTGIQRIYKVLNK